MDKQETGERAVGHAVCGRLPFRFGEANENLARFRPGLVCKDVRHIGFFAKASIESARIRFRNEGEREVEAGKNAARGARERERGRRCSRFVDNC